MLKIPELLEINLVDVCNRSCSFCPRGASRPNTKERMSIEDGRILGRRLKDYSNKITICGMGEPLLHKQFKQVLENCLPKNSTNILITNGDYLTPEIVPDLKDLRIKIIKISLYDSDTSNEFNSFLGDFSVEYRHYYTKEPEVNRVDIYESPDNLNIKRPCYMPFYKMFVNWDLKVYLCATDWTLSACMGDLRTQTLEEVWNSPEYKEYRDMLVQGKRSQFPCSSCSVDGTLRGSEFAKEYK